MLVVFTTTPHFALAERLARSVVERKLAACVQILPQMTSVYVWERKVQSETEHLLLIKTVEEKFDALSEFIRAEHTYDVPEIVAIEAERVSEDYLKWVREVTIDKME
jgi:periplasmic divalent cation tolerance protein